MKIALVALVAFTMQISYAQNHDHHAAHGKKASAHQDQKKTFKPTEDLKIRMEKLLSLTKEFESKKDDRKALISYGDQVSAVVNDIIKTCKLDPEADAAVHPILGTILEGAGELKKGKYESGQSKIHAALLDYGKIFSHEGWKH